jgi:endonuclease YncB( thermonuclease family)
MSRRWRRGLWGVLLLGGALAAALFAQWRPAGPLATCRAVDGDTLRCGAERVRIVGLDTPEMQGRCAAESRLARRAQERLAALSAEGVALEAKGRDRYDRLLAVVRDRDGRDLAAILIREGLARPYDGRGPRASWC